MYQQQPNPQTNQHLSNLSARAGWLNAIINAGSIFISVYILTVALNNFDVNKKTLEIAERNYENNKQNANDGSKIVELLTKINDKLERTQ